MKEFYGEIGQAQVKEPIWGTDAALAAILDSLSAHVVTLDPQGRINYASRSWLKFAHENSRDWIGIGPGADYLAACRAASQQEDPVARQALEGIEAVLAGRLARISLEYPCHERKGRQRWFLMNVDPLPPEHGGVVISHIDITERKQLESALADRDAKFRGIYESNMVPVAFWDLDGHITNANDAYLSLTGFTRAELDEGKLCCGELSPTDQLHLDKQAIQEAIAKGVCTPYEKDYMRRDGRRVPVLIGGGMLPGTADRGVIFGIDLSELKKIEEKLRESEERNRAILRALPDLMFVQSKEGVYLDYHAKDPQTLLMPPEQFLGKNMSEVLPAELAGTLARCFELAMESDEPIFHEYALPVQGEERRWETRIVKYNGDKILAIVRDITERKRAEEALQELVAGTAVTGEEFFPALVWHIAAALGVDCAIVNEVADDEGKKFRSLAVWAGNNWGPRQVYEIANTPCEQVIREGKTCCFPDRVQELFPKAPALKDFNAVSYIGTPLLNSTNRLIGDLCILDNKPLKDEARARSIFEIFAARAAAELERKRTEEALRDSDARLQLAMEAARIGYWQVDFASGKIARSESLERIYGVAPGTMPGTREAFFALVHPEDVEIPRRHLERCIETSESHDIEYRIVCPDGTIRWIASRGQGVLGADGASSRVLGMSVDITERRRAEQALQDLMAGTAVTGQEFFPAYVRHVAAALDVQCAIVAELVDDKKSRLRTLAIWAGQDWIENYEYDVGDAPCGQVVREEKLFYCRERVQELFPRCSALADLNAVSYMGVPLFDSLGQLLGDLCVIDNKRLTDEQRARSVLGIFAIRAAAEIGRKRAEEALRQSDEELKRALTEVERLKERLEAENIYLRREVSEAYRDREIIGRSEGILKVLQQVNQVAGTDMTVLVSGETGTGKELVARAVHGQSGRRERPLVKVNCSALPGELIESELFGHEKGAFTGATGRQVGRFELADGGTIFLDEVGDLPLKLQAKLLRVLQEGEFERLGSGKTIKVDVRVIAATNRNLLEGMHKGRFRPDLYYRLNVYPIRLPPLRERRDDIGLLAEEFLREASRRLGRLFDPIPEEVLEALSHYDWPGNVRELQNVIERAAVISTGRMLQLPEEWAAGWKASDTLSSSPTEGARLFTNSRPFEEGSLDEVGKNHILHILEQTGWRVEGPRGAARILGLNPSTLRSRMQKLGIRRPFRSKAEMQEG